MFMFAVARLEVYLPSRLAEDVSKEGAERN